MRMEIAIVREKNGAKYLIWAVVGILVFLLLFCATVLAWELGGYISEKLIERSGVANSSLVIDSSGVSNAMLDVGMAPAITTLAATNVSMGADTHATLNGEVASLNGFPQAAVYFQWGYDTGYGNATASQTITAVGSYSADINNYNPDREVHYRFVSEADGTSYGADQTLRIHTAAWYSVANSLPLVWVVVVIMMMFGLLAVTRSPVIVLVFGVLIAVLGSQGIQVIRAALTGLWS